MATSDSTTTSDKPTPAVDQAVDQAPVDAGPQAPAVGPVVLTATETLANHLTAMTDHAVAVGQELAAVVTGVREVAGEAADAVAELWADLHVFVPGRGGVDVAVPAADVQTK